MIGIVLAINNSIRNLSCLLAAAASHHISNTKSFSILVICTLYLMGGYCAAP